MEEKEKKRSGIILVIIGLLILALVGAGAGFYFFQEEKLKVSRLSEKLEILKAESRITIEELAQSKARASELEAQLEAARSKTKEMSSGLEEAKGRENDLNSQIKILQSQLQEQQNLKNKLETKEKEAQKEIEDLQISVRNLQAEKNGVEAELGKLKAKTEITLDKIVVEPKKTPGEEGLSSEESTLAEVPGELTQLTTPSLKAKVLTVNEDYDFMVVNLGSKDGISPGELFMVYHNDNYIGNIQAEKVQVQMSAYGFKSNEIKDKIKEGDEVVLGRAMVKKEEPAGEISFKRVPPTEHSAKESQSPVSSTLKGKVLVINKDYNFAVINLGKRDGIDAGQLFAVYHKGSSIGDIQVERTQEVMSACVFVSEEIKSRIEQGDEVIKKQ